MNCLRGLAGTIRNSVAVLFPQLVAASGNRLRARLYPVTFFVVRIFVSAAVANAFTKTRTTGD